jgi:hypothetical protein
MEQLGFKSPSDEQLRQLALEAAAAKVLYFLTLPLPIYLLSPKNKGNGARLRLLMLAY